MYPYAPLNRDTSEIRLVRLSSFDPHEPLTLELCQTPFADAQFTALSYVWGPMIPDHLKTITVDSHPFVIGPNLYDAFVQARQSHLTDWIWTDAICIQQADLDEKAWQVSMMREIYTKAGLVHVWLGRGSDNSDLIMDFMSSVGPRAVQSGMLNARQRNMLKGELRDYIHTRPLVNGVVQHDPNRSELARFLLDLLYERGFYRDASSPETDLAGSLEGLMRREYWHRIWIIQEMALAPDVVLTCGDKSVAFDHFDAMLTAVTYCIQADIRHLRPDTGGFCASLSRNFADNISLTTRRRRCRNEYIQLEDIIFQPEMSPGRPLYRVTDDRDIIYGLLGVIKDGDDLGITVSYKKPTKEVFMAVTRAMIQEGDRSPTKFHLDSCVPRTRDASGLPTWVPDWKDIGIHGAQIPSIRARCVVDATRGLPPFEGPAMGSGDDDKIGRLRRWGCFVDVVGEVMPPPEYDQPSAGTEYRIRDVDLWLSRIMAFTELGPESSPADDRVWRTIMLNCVDGLYRSNSVAAEPVDEEIAPLIRKIMRKEPIMHFDVTDKQKRYIQTRTHQSPFTARHLQPIHDQLDYLKRTWAEEIGSKHRGRTMFKTGQGRLGMGHVAVQTGDVVTLLWGSKSPIVLRKRHEGEGYRFMGDAYVDGIMHGEHLAMTPECQEIHLY